MLSNDLHTALVVRTAAALPSDERAAITQLCHATAVPPAPWAVSREHWMLWHGSTLVAYASIAEREVRVAGAMQRVAWLPVFVVAPAWQRQGMGTALQHLVAAALRGTAYPAAVSHCATDADFWVRCGWLECARHWWLLPLALQPHELGAWTAGVG